jgi:hypothetical protein
MTDALAGAADTMTRAEVVELLQALINEVEAADQLPVFADTSPGVHDYSTRSATSVLATYDHGELRRLGVVKVGKDVHAER